MVVHTDYILVVLDEVFDSPLHQGAFTPGDEDSHLITSVSMAREVASMSRPKK